MVPVLRDDITISDSENIVGTAYKNNWYNDCIDEKEDIQNRQKCKVTNIAWIKYELSVQLQYEQYHADIKVGNFQYLNVNGRI